VSRFAILAQEEGAGDIFRFKKKEFTEKERGRVARLVFSLHDLPNCEKEEDGLSFLPDERGKSGGPVPL